MSDHAFLAPSSAHIWGTGRCAFYPTLSAMHPAPEETREAREGTAAHWWLAEAVMGREWGVGSQAPNGEIVTQEMIDCAQDLLEDVRMWKDDVDHFMCEQRVHMGMIHPTQNWGTTDFAGVSFSRKIIIQRDYKFGHRYVDAFENPQCVDYVVGIASLAGVVLDASWTIDIGIFQPRNYSPEGPRRTWQTNGMRILELANDLHLAAKEATGHDPVARTGDHCGDCEHNTKCTAFQRSTFNGIDLAARGVSHPMVTSEAATARAMVAAALDRLEAMANGLDAQLESALRNGENVPGYELKRNAGRTVWDKPLPEVFALGALYGVDVRKDDALTPKQFADKAKKSGIEVDEAVISAYTRENPGKVVVAPTAKNAAAKAFK